MEIIKSILERLEQGETVRLNHWLTIYYTRESDTNIKEEIGFYANSINNNTTASELEWGLNKITNKKALELISKYLI